MLRRFGSHVRNQWMGALALFVALGGTAYAAATIGSADIIDNSVASVDLKNNDVLAADVLDGTLGGLDVFNGSLTGTDVSNDSLTGADIKEASLAGLAEFKFNNVHRTTTSTTFVDGISFPGLGALQLRCSGLRPYEWAWRFRNGSSVKLTALRDQGVSYGLVAGNEVFSERKYNELQISPGATSSPVYTGTNIRPAGPRMETWSIANSFTTPSPEVMATIFIQTTGDAGHCHAAIMGIRRR